MPNGKMTNARLFINDVEIPGPVVMTMIDDSTDLDNYKPLEHIPSEIYISLTWCIATCGGDDDTKR